MILPMKTFLTKALEQLQGNLHSIKTFLKGLEAKQDTGDWDDFASAASDAWSNPLLSSNQEHYRKFRMIGIVVVGVGRFLFTIFNWLLLIFTGVIIAIAAESLIGYFETKTRRRRLGILLAYFILVGLLLSGVLVMIPFLVNQLGDIIAIIIHRASSVESTLQTVGLATMLQQTWFYDYLKTFGIDLVEPRYLEQLQSIIQNNISAIITFSSGYAKDAGSIVVNTVGGILSTLAQIGFVLTLSVLLSIEKKWFMKMIYRISWNSITARKKVTTLYTKLWFWLRTQILLGIYIGIAMLLGLLILNIFGINIPNKWSLAVISALTELIPYLWPTLGGIPVLVMAGVSNGWFGMLMAWILVFAVQRLENNVLIPLLFKQNLGVSPVVIFLCMVLLWITIGINWVIIAIPIAVIITILFDKNE